MTPTVVGSYGWYMTPAPDLLTSAEAADQFNVSVHTVWRWVREDRLRPAVTLPSGRKRFRREDIEAILRGSETPAESRGAA